MTTSKIDANLKRQISACCESEKGYKDYYSKLKAMASSDEQLIYKIYGRTFWTS